MRISEFKFKCTGIALDIPSARLSVSRWIYRRAYPIRIVSITENAVLVELQAPDTGEHNRAVNALGRILQRQIDRREFVQSRLVPTMERAGA
jgi:hypothetical protein